MKNSIIKVLLALNFMLMFVACGSENKSKPFYNKMYKYKNNEIMEFYGEELVFTFLDDKYFAKYTYDSKKHILTIGDGSEEPYLFLYDKENDSFITMEDDGTLDTKWTLKKYRDFTDEDVKEFQAIKGFLKIINK